MITISLRGSYAAADFFAEIAGALNMPAPASFQDLQSLLSQDTDQEVELTWQDFHQAKVDDLDAMAVADTLRAAAQANPNLRLIFFDSNRGGQ